MNNLVELAFKKNCYCSGLNKHLFYILHFYILCILADAFIQSDLHCIQVTVSTFYQLLLSLGIEPMILALLTPCSTSWAAEKLLQDILLHIFFFLGGGGGDTIEEK